ncbi:MAG: hypothetical protein PVI78_10120, partial [Anaerolineales bacterium]
RWPDFSTITRQMKLENPTDQDGEIYRGVLQLFERDWQRGQAVRLLGVGVADLGPPIRQLKLFDQDWEQSERLLRAIDEIKAKYGRDALHRGHHNRTSRTATRGTRDDRSQDSVDDGE